MQTSDLSPRALSLLSSLPRELSELALGTALRRELSAEEARAAAELHALRRRAGARLEGAQELLLNAKGLEQASDRRVADARAARIGELAPERVVFDGTAGMGSDARALLARGCAVIACERSPDAVRCTAWNLARAGGGPAAVIRADALRPPLRSPAELLLLLDPDRRPGPRAAARGRADDEPDLWSPPLDQALALAARFAGACLKLPPAFEPDESVAAARAGLWQWVSLAGELKELALWTGALAGAAGGGREALILERSGRSHAFRGRAGARVVAPPLEDAAARAPAYLGDPDPALVCSGLLGAFAELHGARPLHARSAYLACGEPVLSPFAKFFRVLGDAPLDRKQVRRLLAAHDVGTVTVKKRGHPDPADMLARRLRGTGRRHGLLIVARLERRHHAYLVTPLASSDPR
jgi:hypothetical protein